MYCPNCGSPLEEDALFCTNCGSKIEPPEQEKMYSDEPVEPVDVPPYAQPITGQGREKPPKKSKTGLIVMIVIIAVLCVAIIAGAVVFVLMQRNKSQKVNAFKDVVESFEEILENSNYSSIEDEVNELMMRCEDAIEEKSVKNFEGLEQEIEDMKENLQNIASQVSSLEDLKNTYQTMVDEQYYVPDDLKQYVDDIFSNLQNAIDNGAGDQLENFKSQMEEMIEGLAQKDKELVDSLMNSVNSIDLSEAEADEKSALESYVKEIGQLMESENYKQAVESAQEYAEYASQVANSIRQRQEESRRQSEEEAQKQQEASAYICPGSNSRYLTEADLAGLTDWQLLLARNEIYARHGRKFDDPNIRAYFESKSWYRGTVDPDSFSTSVFNEYELANIEFIKEHEK